MFEEGPCVGHVRERVPEKSGKLADAEDNGQHWLAPVQRRDQREDNAQEEGERGEHSGQLDHRLDLLHWSDEEHNTVKREGENWKDENEK